MLLPIQKSAMKNCVAADSEISSQTASLPIQKSAMKNYVVADSEIGSDSGVISSFTFFLVFTFQLKPMIGLRIIVVAIK
jgi:hypothetical protein